MPGGAHDKKKKDKKPAAPVIKDMEENHTDTRVSFLLTLMPGFDYGENPMDNPAFVKLFKLQTTVTESNMVLVNGTVTK